MRSREKSAKYKLKRENHVKEQEDNSLTMDGQITSLEDKVASSKEQNYALQKELAFLKEENPDPSQKKLVQYNDALQKEIASDEEDIHALRKELAQYRPLNWSGSNQV